MTYQYLNRTKEAKRILKTNINNGNCDNMGNTNKTVIHIPKTQGWSIFVFISYPLLLKNFTDLQQFLETKRNFALAKKRNPKNLKIKYQERGAKLKCSMDEKAILHKECFLPLYSELNYPDNAVFHNVNRLQVGLSLSKKMVLFASMKTL